MNSIILTSQDTFNSKTGSSIPRQKNRILGNNSISLVHKKLVNTIIFILAG